MQNGKKLFSMLAGIFLMAAGTIWLIVQLLRAFRLGMNLNLAANLNMDLLILLAGLFLLLRKYTPAAILIFVTAFFCLLSYIQSLITMFGYGFNAMLIINLLLGIAVFVLFGVGLLMKKTGALVMCLIAAGLRFILFVISVFRAGGANAVLLITYFATLLLIGGIVMAGLYKMSVREAALDYAVNAYPQYDPNAYLQQGGDPVPQPEYVPAPQQQDNNGGWKPYP